MTKISYIEHNRTVHTLDVANGLSLMEGAVKGGVPGIDAECGGACACATCHVYIDEAWGDKIERPSSMEEGMLDFTNDQKSNSRLSCQIKVKPEFDGLVVRMPAYQH